MVPAASDGGTGSSLIRCKATEKDQVEAASVTRVVCICYRCRSTLLMLLVPRRLPLKCIPHIRTEDDVDDCYRE